MPIKKILTKKPQKIAVDNKIARLSQYLLAWPAKFALISTGLLFASLALVILSAFSQSQTVVQIVMLTTLAASTVFTIRWAIMKAGDAILARRDMLYVMVSFTLISAAITTIALVCARFINMDTVLVYQYMLLARSPATYFTIVLIGLLLGLYVLGLIIFKFIAIYKYARANSVPKWKILLSIPGAISFLGWPAFIADSSKKTNPAISNQSRWLDNLIDFIISKPLYGIAALVLVAALDGFTDIVATISTLVALAIFFAFVKIHGLKKLTAQMPGLFATAAVLLNVISIAAMVFMLSRTPEMQDTETFAIFEQVEITNE